MTTTVRTDKEKGAWISQNFDSTKHIPYRQYLSNQDTKTRLENIENMLTNIVNKLSK